jgi:hypothetical protein
MADYIPNQNCMYMFIYNLDLIIADAANRGSLGNGRAYFSMRSHSLTTRSAMLPRARHIEFIELESVSRFLPIVTRLENADTTRITTF